MTHLKVKYRMFMQKIQYKLERIFAGKRIDALRLALDDCFYDLKKEKEKSNSLLIKLNLEKQRRECVEKSVMHSTEVISKLEDEYIDKIEKLVEKITELKEK